MAAVLQHATVSMSSVEPKDLLEASFYRALRIIELTFITFQQISIVVCQRQVIEVWYTAHAAIQVISVFYHKETWLRVSNVLINSPI